MDPEAKKCSPSYKEMPVAGLVQFDHIRRMALENLAKITCPIFMAFGRHDAAIDIYGSHSLAMKIIKQTIFSKFYDHSKHVITLDYDKDELFFDLWQFLQSQTET